MIRDIRYVEDFVDRWLTNFDFVLGNIKYVITFPLFQVKRSIMLKMADACADSSKQTRFHEMHVQRHNNVSILYADIVNFTPLSERLTASDLVKTLNELFGRFDQIAQVSAW